MTPRSTSAKMALTPDSIHTSPGRPAPVIASYRRTASAFLILLLFGTVVLTTGCGGSGVDNGVNTGSAASQNPTNASGNDDGSAAAGSGSAVLSWDASVTRTDGSTLTGDVVYKLYYGTAPGQYSSVMEVGSVTTVTVQDLAPGVYYFAVTACDILGLESGYSNEISKDI